MSAASTPEQESLVSEPKEAVIEALPTEETAIESGKAVLEFTGEAWINGRARAVDNKEETFTVPLTDLQVSGTWAIDDAVARHHVADDLHQHENAPNWVQNWNGPFELQVKSIEV